MDMNWIDCGYKMREYFTDFFLYEMPLKYIFPMFYGIIWWKILIFMKMYLYYDLQFCILFFQKHNDSTLNIHIKIQRFYYLRLKSIWIDLCALFETGILILFIYTGTYPCTIYWSIYLFSTKKQCFLWHI